MKTTTTRTFPTVPAAVTLVAVLVTGLLVALRPSQLSLPTVMAGLTGGLLVVVVPLALSPSADSLGSRVDGPFPVGVGLLAPLVVVGIWLVLFGALHAAVAMTASIAVVSLLVMITA